MDTRRAERRLSQVYTQENVSYLEVLVEAGGFAEGASDPTLQRLRVVAE